MIQANIVGLTSYWVHYLLDLSLPVEHRPQTTCFHPTTISEPNRIFSNEQNSFWTESEFFFQKLNQNKITIPHIPKNEECNNWVICCCATQVSPGQSRCNWPHYRPRHQQPLKPHLPRSNRAHHCSSWRRQLCHSGLSYLLHYQESSCMFSVSQSQNI